MPSDPVQCLSGADAVVAAHGEWPSFHDAEILDLHLAREGVSTVSIQLMSGPHEGRVVTFSIRGIASLTLDGEHVNVQNVISGLEIEKTDQGIRLTFGPCYGLAGEIIAEDVTVGLDSGDLAVKAPIIMQSVRPGQLDPNVFEVAVLERIAAAHPPLRPHLAHLRVLKREFTGVGSYTRFLCENCTPDLPDGHLSMNDLITMPGVPYGMGAVLFCKEGHPTTLEIFTYGEALWDGIFSGFSFKDPLDT